MKLSNVIFASILMLVTTGLCEQIDSIAAEREQAKELVKQARSGDTTAVAKIGKLSPEVAVPLLQPGALLDYSSPAAKERAKAALRDVEGAVPYLESIIRRAISHNAQDHAAEDAFKTLAILGTDEAIVAMAPHVFNKSILRSGMEDVADWRVDWLAAQSLAALNLPTVPTATEPRNYQERDLDAWREWWKENHKKYGATEVPPITETDPADLERYARARATPTPGPDDVVNLARVTDAKVIASRINGDRKQDDVYFGVLNAFDGGTHFFRNTSYSTWGADPRDEDPWIQVRFSKPVTITGLVVEPAIPKFRAEIFGEKEKLREIEGKGAVELPTPLKGVSRVRLHFDTFMKEGMPMVIQEIKVMGYTPDGRKGTALTPNLDLSPVTGQPVK